jgi:hypothetical protein
MVHVGPSAHVRPIEDSIAVLNQPLWKGAIRLVEIMQRGERNDWGDFEDADSGDWSRM